MTADLSKIPPDLAAIYKELEDDLCQTEFRWQVFRQLYATNKERIDLMESVACGFFREVESLLIDGVFLHICRMTDPSSQGKHENLVLEQIVNGLDAATHGPLIAKMQMGLADIKTKTAAIHVHRNKRIAHFDKPTMLGPPDAVLPGVSLNAIEAALTAIGDFLNLFRMEFFGDTMYRKKVLSHDDGDSLVHFLKYGVAFDEMVREDWTLYESKIKNGPFGNA